MITPKRHLFLTIWLSLIIAVNLFVAGVYFIYPQKITSVLPNLPNWYTYVFGVFGILNVVYAVALFKWKKWGFWGFCFIAFLSAALNFYFKLAGLLPTIAVPIISILILYWALHVGKENKAWPRLT